MTVHTRRDTSSELDGEETRVRCARAENDGTEGGDEVHHAHALHVTRATLTTKAIRAIQATRAIRVRNGYSVPAMTCPSPSSEMAGREELERAPRQSLIL